MCEVCDYIDRYNPTSGIVTVNLRLTAENVDRLADLLAIVGEAIKDQGENMNGKCVSVGSKNGIGSLSFDIVTIETIRRMQNDKATHEQPFDIITDFDRTVVHGDRKHDRKRGVSKSRNHHTP